VARKNGNGEGSRPRKRPDGHWEARYWSEGRRRSAYGGTRKEAAEKLAKACHGHICRGREPPTSFVPPSITLSEFLAQYEDAVRYTMKRRSFETYLDIARLHLLPAFRNTKLKDLTREQVQRMYARKRDEGLLSQGYVGYMACCFPLPSTTQ
jgi:hypothetical protein